MEITNLRDRLRHDLSQAHQELDDLVSTFDLATYQGFAAFLLMHEAGFRAIGGSAVGRDRSMVFDLQDRAARDLKTLGLAPLAGPQDIKADYAPEAVTYVAGGSRLGSKVLRKRWARSDDMRVRAAASYFAAPSYAATWREFVNVAGREPAQTDRASRIVTDAQRFF